MSKSTESITSQPITELLSENPNPKVSSLIHEVSRLRRSITERTADLAYALPLSALFLMFSGAMYHRSLNVQFEGVQYLAILAPLVGGFALLGHGIKQSGRRRLEIAEFSALTTSLTSFYIESQLKTQASK